MKFPARKDLDREVNTHLRNCENMKVLSKLLETQGDGVSGKLKVPNFKRKSPLDSQQRKIRHGRVGELFSA
ncbi:MAG TPA: hypothetical protein VFM35_12145 [Candidatus Binatia bacterium]|nr:hypothetical protein [Candidatus Binatia bacterium]